MPLTKFDDDWTVDSLRLSTGEVDEERATGGEFRVGSRNIAQQGLERDRTTRKGWQMRAAGASLKTESGTTDATTKYASIPGKTTRKEATREAYRQKQEEYFQLVEKDLEGRLTAEEEQQLRLVNWELDRMEEAQNPELFDYLDNVIEHRKAIAEQIQNFADDMKARVKDKEPSRKKRRKRKRVRPQNRA